MLILYFRHSKHLFNNLCTHELLYSFNKVKNFLVGIGMSLKDIIKNVWHGKKTIYDLRIMVNRMADGE